MKIVYPCLSTVNPGGGWTHDILMLKVALPFQSYAISYQPVPTNFPNLPSHTGKTVDLKQREEKAEEVLSDLRFYMHNNPTRCDSTLGSKSSSS